MKNINKIQKRIEEGKLIEASDLLLSYIEEGGKSPSHADVIQIKSILSRLKKDKESNAVLNSDYSVEMSRCTSALLSFVKQLKDNAKKTKENKSENGEIVPNFYIGEKYKIFKSNLVQILNDFKNLIEKYQIAYKSITGKTSKDVTFYNWINEDSKLIQTDTFTIITIGEPNVGKSYLNNLFMGIDLLGVDEFTETATLTIINNNDNEKSATINFYQKNLLSELKDELEVATSPQEKFFLDDIIVQIETTENLKKHLGAAPKKIILNGKVSDTYLELKKYSSAKAKGSLNFVVKYIEVNYPTQLSHNNIILVDAPGLNDINPLRSRLTKEYLEYSNTIIYCVSPGNLVTENLYKNLHYIVFNQLAEKLIIVINKIDTIPSTSVEKYIQELQKNLLDIKKMILLEVESQNHTREYLVKYVNKIFDQIPIFPISALKASESIANQTTRSPYYKGYVELSNYIDNIQSTPEYYALRIQKFLTKYVKKVNDFEEKIVKSIKIKEEEREEEIRTKLQTIKLFLEEFERRSKSTFDNFEKSLKKNLEDDLEKLSAKSEFTVMQEAIKMVDDCVLQGSMSERKEKIRQLIEYTVQPHIKNSLTNLSDKINSSFNEIIKKEIEELKRNLEVLTLGIENDFLKANDSTGNLSIPEVSDVREISTMFLNTLTFATYLGMVVATPILFALVPATIGGIVLGAIGFFATLITGVGLMNWFGGIVDAIRDRITATLKSKIKSNLENKIPEIYKSVKRTIKIDEIVASTSNGLFKEFESKVAEQQEPLEIALSTLDTEEISERFEPVFEYIKSLRINMNALHTIFSAHKE